MKDYYKHLLKQRASTEGWNKYESPLSFFVIWNSHTEEEKDVWGLQNTPSEIDSV